MQYENILTDLPKETPPETPRKMYISGPMTGLPDHNFPAFLKAERVLAAQGYIPVSPHRTPPKDSWEGYMREDIKLLCECDCIVLLPGWETSRGAKIEYQLAQVLKMKAYLFIDAVTPFLVETEYSGDGTL